MKLLYVLACGALLCTATDAIIIRDDDRRVSDQRPYHQTTPEAYPDEEELARRRHHRRRRPCASSKVEPINEEGTDKTLINLYYADVDLAESTNNYLTGASAGSSGGFGCGSSFVDTVSGDDVSNNRPLGSHSQSKPGVFGMLLSNVLSGNRPSGGLFGGQHSQSKPGGLGTLVSNVVNGNRPFADSSSTGPLGGSVPDEVRFFSVSQSKDPIVDIPLQENGQADCQDKGHGDTLVTHPTSYFETFTHLFRGNVGSGMYAMGDAFRNAGLVFGAVVTLFLGVISVHSQHLLLTCSEEMQRRLKLSSPPDFATTIELCFSVGPLRFRSLAPVMRQLVNIFLCVTQLGFCCVYFVFISTNIKKIFDHYEMYLDVHLYMMIVLVPILLACLVRNLKFLAPLSTLANLLMIVGISITLYFATLDLPPVSSRRWLADWNKLPLYFGTTIYAFEGIGLVLPLKNEMKEPKKFVTPLGVLNTGMTLVTALLISIGFLGFLKWGEEVQGSLTLNLPGEHILSLIVQGILAVGITFTYPIQFYVPIDIIWPGLKKKYGPFKSPNTIETLLRIGLVFLTFILAEAIPNLGLFISLVGAVSSTALALLFPPIIELISRSQDPGGIPTIVIVKNIFILLIGVTGFLTGTYESINAIVRQYIKK